MQQKYPQAHWAQDKIMTGVVMGCCLALMGGFWGGMQYAQHRAKQFSTPHSEHLLENLYADSDKIVEIRSQAEAHLSHINQQMGRIEAHITRVNVLGEKIRDMLNGDPREFNFRGEPEWVTERQVVPESSEAVISQLRTYEAALQNRIVQLETLHRRAQQLRTAEDLALQGSGNPVDSGKISSYYGRRRDPLHGHMAWHAGVDIAAHEGAKIKALAGGMVKFAGQKAGYGHLVEIDHGDGVITRYGHNRKIFVKPGQVIHKGDIIALLGSSGRSTGPHVHLEILKNGRAVDPGHYFSDLRRS